LFGEKEGTGKLAREKGKEGSEALMYFAGPSPPRRGEEKTRTASRVEEEKMGRTPMVAHSSRSTGKKGGKKEALTLYMEKRGKRRRCVDAARPPLAVVLAKKGSSARDIPPEKRKGALTTIT